MTKLLTSLFLLATLFGSSALRPIRPQTQPPLACLAFGTWGNDWPLCGRVIITPTSRGTQEQRLAEELKLTIRANGTGELSFYDCQTQQRIPNPLTFSYSVVDGQLQFNWTGTPDEIRLSTMAFSYKNNFTVSCRQDTLFVDSLLQNTMYRGATYFLRRN